MNKKLIFLILLALMASVSFAQSVGINDNGSSPNSSAMLDVSSTTKGFLPPRMTYAEKTAIASPTAGLIVWCSNCGTSGELQVYNGTTWTNLIGGTASSGLPGAPTIGSAVLGPELGQANVSFTAPTGNGGTTITSYTATSSPGDFTGTLNQAGSGTITVSGLTGGQAYTFTVTATNANGTGPASGSSNSVTIITSIYSIGQEFQGGKIFYIDNTGLHGLIAATTDQSTGIRWAYVTNAAVPDGTSNDIGTGSVNTDHIITQNSSQGTQYAASLARAYNGGGYNDWYLPSRDELNQMYLQRESIGTFPGAHYWSSSENWASSTACVQYFTTGVSGSVTKSTSSSVRAIRSF
ncbi:MAG: DUF1566 domain-containing protein [Bacteroidetes bacterium]|nr:DUF1566 domain-containing protein [Bacteroidota bacterium]